MARGTLRALVVQTSTSPTSETMVAARLLSALEGPANEAAPRVETLLFQGVKTSGMRAPHPVTAPFSSLPHVVVRTVRMGNLGLPVSGRLARARKCADLLPVVARWRSLLRHARAFAPNVIYSAQQVWDIRLAARLARALGCPQIVHLHYVCGPWLGREVLEVLPRAALVICVSDFIRSDAIGHGIPPERAVTLRNSLAPATDLSPERRAAVRASVRAELGAAEDAVLVGMLARLAPWKGQTELLRAMLPILAVDPRAHLVLAGSEYPRANGMTTEMIAMSAVAGVADRVHILGQRSDVPRLLDALDVYGHPSRAEPCSMAILEAMAHGLPVVSWREGGTVELIVDHRTGILAETMDVDALSGALAAMVEHSALRTEMGERGRARVADSFRPQAAGACFRSLLEETAGRGRCRS
jgi:glycosyltransferase involved in cell wall biosynthesis